MTTESLAPLHPARLIDITYLRQLIINCSLRFGELAEAPDCLSGSFSEALALNKLQRLARIQTNLDSDSPLPPADLYKFSLDSSEPPLGISDLDDRLVWYLWLYTQYCAPMPPGSSEAMSDDRQLLYRHLRRGIPPTALEKTFLRLPSDSGDAELF